MTDNPKTFELTMRIRNNLLKQRRIDLNLSARALSEQVGIPYSSYVQLENMREPPLRERKRGRRGMHWSNIALKLAEFYRCMPEDLFPSAVLAVAHPVVVKKLEAQELCPLLGSQCDGTVQALPPSSAERTEKLIEIIELIEHAGLTPREDKVISMMLGLHSGISATLDEVALEYGVKKERVRQIQEEALRKIRHHAKSGYERAVENFLASLQQEQA